MPLWMHSKETKRVKIWPHNQLFPVAQMEEQWTVHIISPEFIDSNPSLALLIFLYIFTAIIFCLSTYDLHLQHNLILIEKK